MRITVNVKDDIVEKLDKYAEDYGLTRSAAATLLLAQAFKAEKAMTDLSELVKLVKEANVREDE